MKKIICYNTLFLLAITAGSAQHPQKFDSLYKTIHAREFCKLLQQDQSVVLLDVRSAGEYSDTSRYNSLNMGHLKNAINMEIDTMRKNPAILNQFRNKTLVVYCSHSQRSRRVSKLLAEQGFTNFYNLNGGMSLLNQLDKNEFPCKQDLVVTGTGYTNVSNVEAVQLLKKQLMLVILDVRPANQFNSIDTLEENNTGKLKKAINIPYAELTKQLGQLEKYRTYPILVYASSGDGDAARAASQLVAHGYTKVYHLLGGLEDLAASKPNSGVVETSRAYQLVDPRFALALLKKEAGLVIYDTRSLTEFENRDSLTYKNLGRIKNAVHADPKALSEIILPADQLAPILIYGHAEAYQLARMFTGRGYKKVYLMNGLYDFFWSSFNVAACKEAKDFLVNHEGIY